MRTLEYIFGMLFSVTKLSKLWDIRPSGILHVGAHDAEEASDYENAGWLPVVWVEGQTLLAKKIRARLNPNNHTVIQAFVWDSAGDILKFKRTNNSQSSSLLEFGTHASDYPNVNVQEEYSVTTSRLDDVVPISCRFDFINLDLQGVEMQALKGLGERVKDAKWIYSEVNKKMVYKDCTLIVDLDKYLKQYNFRRVATRWVYGKGWGDALYIQRSVKVPTIYILQRIWMSLNWHIISTITFTKQSVWNLAKRLRVIDAK
jgi:FkbM family methyltransferase